MLRSKLSETGILRFIPSKLALMAVQRQMAASRSARPFKRVQQGAVGGVPMTTPTNPPSKFAQTPNLRVSLGHLPLEAGVGVGFGFGFGFGFGLGLGLGLGLVGVAAFTGALYLIQPFDWLKKTFLEKPKSEEQ